MVDYPDKMSNKWTPSGHIWWHMGARKSPSEPIRNPVKPVVNAIRILRLLSKDLPHATATQVARALNINASTCFNVLRTLVGEGVLEFDSASKTYSVGLGMVDLVNRVLTADERLLAAKPLMHEVVAQYGVTITLWKRSGVDRVILVSVEENSSHMGIRMRVGQRRPLLVGATGRLTANRLGLTKPQLRAAFKELRWDKPISFEDYMVQVSEAEKRGWAIDDGYFVEGVLIVAAPIFDSTDKFSYSLVAATFRNRLTKREVTKLGEELVKIGAKIQNLLRST